MPIPTVPCSPNRKVQGNINVLVFRVPEMAERLDSTGGIVPEFVNPKWADAESLVSKLDGKW